MSTLSIHQTRRWIKQSEHPVARKLLHIVKALRAFEISLPRPICHLLYNGYRTLRTAVSELMRVFWWTPLFKGRLTANGKRLNLYGGLPYISGPLQISLGDDCRISGQTTFTGRTVGSESPRLIVGHNVDISWMTTIAVGRQVRIGDNVRIAGRAFLAGYPGHPLNAEERAAGLPEADEQVGDIILENDVWLATGVSVMAGVRIGRGTIVAAGSVVTRDLPAFVLAGGIPAKVIHHWMGESNMSRDLIVFGEDWGGLPSSSQHLVSHLAESRKVIWVNSIGLRRPRLNSGDLKRLWSKLRGKMPSAISNNLPENLQIVQPRTLPAPRGKLQRELAARLLQRQIMPVVKKASLNRPILWASLPTAVDMAGRLNESALVYYCGDDFSALAGVDHQVVSQHEQELVQRSDLIMAASDVLASRFPAATTRVLPHGVDFDLFSRPVPRATDLPDDGRPIAGFYGSLSEWLDRPLLVEVIQQLPEWHFVFIGKADVDMGDLQRLHNVTLLGPRPHQQLPSYSQHWNLGLLPFCDNPQIRACNPLKLREYLATGRPVVSTDFPAAQHYSDLIHIVNSAEEMVGAICNARFDGDSSSRQAAVAQHTWQARADMVAGWLERL